MNLTELVQIRNVLATEHRNLYVKTINELNEKYKSELNNSLGNQLFIACKDDLLGEFVRRFFNTSDYYITVDQLWKRITTFSYENDYDPLSTDEGYKKSVMNYTDPKYDKDWKSTTTLWIDEVNEKHKVKVFPEKRTGNEPLYGPDRKKHSTRTAYKGTLNNGEREMKEDLTGETVDKGTLEGDHIIAVKSAEVNERYLKQSFFDERDQFYNSSDNMQYINERANNVKSDVATLKEVVNNWENTKSEEARRILTETGYLDENGKVNKEVKKKLEKQIDSAGNAESKFKLKHTDYKNLGVDAANQTAIAIPKMIVGQVVYYALPPILYEIRRIIKSGVSTLEQFIESFELAMKRTINYVASNMKNMFKNVANSTIKKLVKTFFDIIISLVKSTVRRILTVVKDLALAVIDSTRILFSKNATAAEKADSISRLLILTITNTIIIVGLELLEKQLGLPSFAMEAFELIGVIIVSNLVTLILNKADLFDVRYGLKTQNLKKLIDEHHVSYGLEAKELIQTANNDSDLILQKVNADIKGIQLVLSNKDLYKDDIFEELDKFNKTFNMEIDFNEEWNNYLCKEI